MSSNYLPIDAFNAITDSVNQHLLPAVVLAGLIREGGITNLNFQSVNLSSGNLGSIPTGTDVVFYHNEQINSQSHIALANTPVSVDLSQLNTSTVKALNALIFSTDSSIDVELTLAKKFSGAVVLGGGDDILNADKSTKAIDISGGYGNDTITTGSGNDTVKAGDGDDVITTGKGNDQIVGGAGNDTIHAGTGNDTIYAGQGSDSIDAGSGNDRIIIRNNDSTNTNEDPNFVDGGTGKDVIDLSSAATIDVTGEVKGIDAIGYVDSDHDSKVDINETVTFHFANGSSVAVTNVEKFIGDLDGDGGVETVNLVGLSDFFTS